MGSAAGAGWLVPAGRRTAIAACCFSLGLSRFPSLQASPPHPTPPHPHPASRLDPPANFFRIRLVCTLLEVCGQYFTRGAARKKLDRFLPYLQVSCYVVYMCVCSKKE